MSISRSNKQQLTLAGYEQAECACGCGHFFMRAARGRRALYVNPTHKKRAARARQKAARTEARVVLMPKGWLYFQAATDAERAKLWSEASDDDKALIGFMCKQGWNPDYLLWLAKRLFGYSVGRDYANPHANNHGGNNTPTS